MSFLSEVRQCKFPFKKYFTRLGGGGVAQNMHWGGGRENKTTDVETGDPWTNNNNCSFEMF